MVSLPVISRSLSPAAHCILASWSPKKIHRSHCSQAGQEVFYLSRELRVCSVMSDSLRPPGTVACQAPLSMGFSRQEYWSGFGLPFPPPGDVLNPDPCLLHCRQILYHGATTWRRGVAKSTPVRRLPTASRPCWAASTVWLIFSPLSLPKGDRGNSGAGHMLRDAMLKQSKGAQGGSSCKSWQIQQGHEDSSLGEDVSQAQGLYLLGPVGSKDRMQGAAFLSRMVYPSCIDLLHHS